MLTNYFKETWQPAVIGKVEFISYTGEYPNLCSGILTLMIEGELCAFGYIDRATGEVTEDVPVYDPFWSTGGECIYNDETYNYEVSNSEWVIDYDDIPDKFKKYAYEIDKVFNANVEYGCCGGCA